MTAARQDAERYIATAIEANGRATADRAEYDVPAIADALYEVAGGWDLSAVDEAEFWATVEAHALTPLMDQVEQAASAALTARTVHLDAVERRDDAIRAALAAGHAASVVAEVAGLTPYRVYQIRDRRR